MKECAEAGGYGGALSAVAVLLDARKRPLVSNLPYRELMRLLGLPSLPMFLLMAAFDSVPAGD